MNLQEAFEALKNLPDTTTLEDLSKLAGSLSARDNYAGEDAVTHLYTKTTINDLIQSNKGKIRAINNTDAAEFLSNKVWG
ncbi:hypothetical protein [Filifactor alocis]